MSDLISAAAGEEKAWNAVVAFATIPALRLTPLPSKVPSAVQHSPSYVIRKTNRRTMSPKSHILWSILKVFAWYT